MPAPHTEFLTVPQALLQVLEPHFHPSSHGFRPRRGAHTAVAEAKEHLAAGYTVVVDLDLAKFFDRVHHQRLLSRMGQRVADTRILRLVRLILRARVRHEDGTLQANRPGQSRGTPQGGPLSPLLSTIVLDEFDWELARRGHRFVRYADDCQVFVRSERAGLRVMDSLTRFLESRETPRGDDPDPDPAELGPVADVVHRGPQPLSVGLDCLFPAVHARRGATAGGV